MAMRLPAGAQGIGQPMAETPPPLRLLQRWQPAASPAAARTLAEADAGRWARWRRQLRALITG